MASISSGEQKYIEGGCNFGLRYDGRGFDDFRGITIENNVFPHLNGSCRVKLSDSVDVICSIKLDVMESNPNCPDVGSLEVGVEISPSCKMHADERALLEEGALIADNLESILMGSSAINLADLCIIKGKYCWSLQIDFLILLMDGDPLDVCSIAAFVALNCAKVPEVQLRGKAGLEDNFEIVGDMEKSKNLNCTRIPICITLAKIHNSFVIDTSKEEQDCATCILSIAVDAEGTVCGIKYLKRGTFSTAEITSAIQRAGNTAAAVFTQLHGFVNSMAAVTADEKRFPDCPPVRSGLLAV